MNRDCSDIPSSTPRRATPRWPPTSSVRSWALSTGSRRWCRTRTSRQR